MRNKINLLKSNSKYLLVPSYRHISGLSLWKEELSSEAKHKIESYWSSKLKYAGYNGRNPATKYYVLSMFPYPSGSLHMGHVRVYTISDVIARFQRMNGKNVIHPIGWDAFGLPAENAAIERNIAPEEWSKSNIANMKLQLQKLGCSFEWHRELSTCDPHYYKWTQDLFLKLYDAGLAYQKRAVVNWDPVDQTVLADEQVDENGRSWRSGAKVETRLLKQWFVRTTHFAKDLLEGLDDPVLQDWRDIIKIQKHWIGDCNGMSFDFQFTNESQDVVTLWTMNPEYIENASFVALSKTHILNDLQPSNHDGTKLLNFQARNPITGELLPVFVTDEIEFLDSTNSYIGIPHCSEKDAVFCEKYDIENSLVPTLSEKEVEEKRKLISDKAKKLKVGGQWVSAKLRDWLISRQRYWGTPIPIIHCSHCGAVPVPRSKLPVQLPKLNDLSSKKGVSYLSEETKWVNTICPKCERPAKRETDTMDTFVDSSWYYLRYLNPQNNQKMFDVEQAKTMTPVDLYIGGKEHATLHLYYARFISHFLHSLGLLPEREPFKRLLVQGMVMGRSYRIKGTGQYVKPEEVEVLDMKRNIAKHKTTSKPVTMAWEKMSKSKHNGVDPDSMFAQYGIDTTRLLILADVAPTSHRNWNTNTFPGILNWQKRLWWTIQKFIEQRKNLRELTLDKNEFQKYDNYMFDSRNFYIKGATFNYSNSQQLSVAISKMLGLTNSLRKVPLPILAHSLQFERALACQLVLLAPMAPHFASELWSGFCSASNRLNKSSEILWDKTVLEQIWPQIDRDYNMDLVCQVNDVERSVVKIPKYKIEHLEANEAIRIALQQRPIQEDLMGRTVLNTKFTLEKDYEGVVKIYTKSNVLNKNVNN